MALLLAVIAIGAVLATKQFNAVISVLIGGAGSYGYFLLLASRIHRAGNMDSSAAVGFMRTGAQVRISYICAMSAIAFKVPNIKVLPFFLGLFTYQLLVHIEGIYAIVRGYLNPFNKRRG